MGQSSWRAQASHPTRPDGIPREAGLAMPEKPASGARAQPRDERKFRMPKGELEALLEEAVIDAYGEEEQVTAFYTMLDEYLALPFEATVLGVDVTVDKLDITDGSDDIVIVCRRGPDRQKLPILDLPLPDPPPEGWQWVEAYRYWTRSWRGG